MGYYARPLLVALAVAAVCDAFNHEWTTVQDQMFGWLGNDFVDGQVEWYASNYPVRILHRAIKLRRANSDSLT